MTIKDVILLDECNASVPTSDDVMIERGVEITQSEFERKRKILSKLLQIGTLTKNTKFNRVTVGIDGGKNTSARMEVCFFTKYNASLNVTLMKYSNGTCFLCTRGSPTKLLSGQNVLAVEDSNTISIIRRKLDCTNFEALSVLGFRMIRQCIAKELPREGGFYTDVETNKLDTLDISIYSVTFSTNVQFGRTQEERNKNLDFMAYVATAKTSSEGVHFGLSDYLGIRIKNWRVTDEDKEGYVGQNTGILFQKNRSDGSMLVKQMYYLKMQEVKAKTYSGVQNRAVIEGLSSDDREALANSLIRVDNTFGKEYIKEWLSALTGKVYESRDTITIREANPLCDSIEYVAAMAAMATNDIGIRTLLLSPMLRDIENIMEVSEHVTDSERRILRNWMSTDVKLETNTKGQKRLLRSKVFTHNDMVVKRLNEKLMALYYLDIRLPFDFYSDLETVRLDHTLSLKERKALNHDRSDYGGYGSYKDMVPAIKERTRREAEQNLLVLRKLVKIPPPKSKQNTIKELTFN